MLNVFRGEGDLVVKLIIALAWLLALAIAITVHEYGHARSARSRGDTTAEEAGRVSLNPLKHYDLVGSTMILLFGFGWAKPVPINPMRMRNPRLDALIVSLWGPFSNVLVALLAAAVIRLLPESSVLPKALLGIILTVNLLLAFFNLLPLPPLDGSRIITYLLPPKAALKWEMFMGRYGFLLLIALLWVGGSGAFRFVGQAVDATQRVLLGGA